MSTTNQLLAKLRTLATKAGESIYERVVLAETILADDAWVAREHKGDLDRAERFLEADCFPELCKAFGLDKLLVLRQHYHSLDEWRARKFNLVLLWADLQSARKKRQEAGKPTAPRETATFKELKATNQRLEQANLRLRTADEALMTKDQRIEQLESRERELVGRVAHLEGRCSALESQVASLERLLGRHSSVA
jgi:hypothetical protein